MEKHLPLEEQSINQIFCDSQEPRVYQIPVYQRNYAWEEEEIKALIKDVCDSCGKKADTPYYIGTLVTYKRGDNIYEVIDGQQRLTTIYIILKVLDCNFIRNKLTYTARKVSAETIQNMPEFGDNVDVGIKHGFSYAHKALLDIVGEESFPKFLSYFLHYVHIIHYQVPRDVDLNHYFEVMNSRGEQLEKHEIIKSTLSDALKEDKAALATFCRVWEACSEMNTYIQHSFHVAEIFGNDYTNFVIDSFSGIPVQDYYQGKDTIKNLLSKPIEKLDDEDDNRGNDNFQPIIDFPNFLLIVLKLTMLRDGKCVPDEFSLDDKELVNKFRNAIPLENPSDMASFAKRFVYNLLKARYLLDNYVVHHVLSEKEQKGDNPWRLRRYYHDKTNSSPKNLSENRDIQLELVHLLSMFEVTFTPKQRKNYLFYTLVHLFEDRDVKNYLAFLQNLAHKYFFDVYLNEESLNDRNQPKPNAFDNSIIKDGQLSLGITNVQHDYSEIFTQIYCLGDSNISLYVFNYTDYRLWKKYANEIRGEESDKENKRRQFFGQLGCSEFSLDIFNDFYFSRSRKSLEHYYPRAKAVDPKNLIEGTISTVQINCFGNFGMIGADANSSGSSWDPKTKLDHYLDGKSNQISVSSLKFMIMMQVCRDNMQKMMNGTLYRSKGMEWNFEDMQFHQQKMIEIICER